MTTPEIESPFTDEPRKVSPGEAQQEAASTVAQVAQKLGLKLSERASLALGRFVVNVLDSLNEEDQRKAAGEVAKVIKWWVK